MFSVWVWFIAVAQAVEFSAIGVGFSGLKFKALTVNRA